MFRFKPAASFSISVIFLVALTLSLPFVHLHPRIAHADALGEHTHSGVIHTIFSSENASNLFSSVDGLDSESSVELFQTAIDLDLFAQRPSSDTISNVLTTAWVSSDFFLSSPIPIYTSPVRSNVLSPPSSWMGSLPFLRGPPFLVFS